MRRIPIESPFNGIHPWEVSLGSRLKMLFPSSLRIAFVHQEPNQSTFRYRCYNIANKINEQETKISATWFYYKEISVLIENIEFVDVIVLSRLQFDSAVMRLIGISKLKGKIVLFDLDDLVINADLIPLIVSTVGFMPKSGAEEEKLWNYWFAYVGRLRMTLNECHGVISSTTFLSESILGVIEKPVITIENFIGTDQLIFSEDLFKHKLQNHKKEHGFSIGYFSGSPSHDKDFQIAQDGIAEFLNESKRNRLVIVGHLNLSGDFLRTFGKQIELKGLTDYLTLQKSIAEVDLNIVPLQDNEFTRAKSILKYFDAAIVGTPTLASKTGQLKNAIDDRMNGFLVSENDWHGSIVSIANEKSEKMSSVIIEAHNLVKSEYTGSKVAEIFLRFISSFKN